MKPGRGCFRLLLALVLLLPPLPAWSAAGTELHFGVFAYRPEHLVRVRYQPLMDYLAQRLGVPVRLEVMTQEEMSRALAANQLDFFLTNPSHFLVIRSERSLTGVLATLITEQDGEETSSLGGVIFTRAERRDINRLASLAGKTIASPGFHFLGGFQAQALELRDAGVDVFRQSRMELTGSHDHAVAAVLSGVADAGFVRTGILEQLIRSRQLDPEQIRILNRQNLPGFPYMASTRLYPEWPLAALPHVPTDMVRRVASALFALEPEHPVARAAGIAGFAPPADYQSVEHLARTLRIAPYDQLPLVTWVDVFRQYRPWLMTVSFLLLLLLATVVWLARKQRALSLAQQRLRRLVQGWPQPMLVLRGAAFIDCNQAAMELIRGDGPDALIGRSLDSFLVRAGGAEPGLTGAAILARVAAGKVERGEWLLRCTDGQEVWVDMTLSPLHERGEKEPYVLCAWYDISARREAEQRQRMMAHVFDHAREAIFVTDEHGCIIDVNEAYEAITGHSRQDALGQLPPLPLEEGPGVFVSARERGFWSGEFSCRLRAGGCRILALTVSAVTDEGGEVRHFVGIFLDTTRIRAQEEKLLSMAHYDTLTGLPNRELFRERLQQAMNGCHQQGHQLAVICIDLDGFGPVNDAFGREAGDELLTEIACRLRARLGEEDTLARLDGDEFAVLVAGPDSRERLRDLLSRLLQAVAEPVWVANHPVEVSASIGYSLYPGSEQLNGDQLLRQASQAMCRAKQAGGNRSCGFSDSLS